MPTSAPACPTIPDCPNWQEIAKLYPVSPDFINLENGYCSVMAQPVLNEFLRWQEYINAQNSRFLRQEFPARLPEIMAELAQFCGVDSKELLLTRNLVEAMNILLQGYPFAPGDEIIACAHDYPSVLETLHMVAHRRAARVTILPASMHSLTDAQIVAAYEAKMTPRTRAILLTHLVNRNGQVLPVAAIAAAARARGIDVFIDAAHSFAQLDYRLPDLGADFVAVNLHKWLGAPLGMALLYIRRPRIADIAPLYGDTSHDVADIEKLGHFGSIPPAPLMTIPAALALHQQIGSQAKYERLCYLARYWMEHAAELPQLEINTPPRRHAALGTFAPRRHSAQQVVRMLHEEAGIFTTVQKYGEQDLVRVTPHLFTATTELDALLRALSRLL